jgi:hypothetical protein
MMMTIAKGLMIAKHVIETNQIPKKVTAAYTKYKDSRKKGKSKLSSGLKAATQFVSDVVNNSSNNNNVNRPKEIESKAIVEEVKDEPLPAISEKASNVRVETRGKRSFTLNSTSSKSALSRQLQKIVQTMHSENTPKADVTAYLTDCVNSLDVGSVLKDALIENLFKHVSRVYDKPKEEKKN